MRAAAVQAGWHHAGPHLVDPAHSRSTPLASRGHPPRAPLNDNQESLEMKYLSMIRITENSGVAISQKLMEDMGKLMDELTRSGKLMSTAGLRPTAEGVRVRQRQGKQSVTDGPFVETKEVV